MQVAHNGLPTRFMDGRHIAFLDGVKRCGYTIREGIGDPEPGDIALCWNLFGGRHKYVEMFKNAEARVLVFEEAYIRKIGAQQYFAVGVNGHNGAGRWPDGGSERWDSWGIDIQPWKRHGSHILVCGQRGFGRKTGLSMAMEDSWPQDVLKELRRVSDRPIWFRPHPGAVREWDVSGFDKVCDGPLDDDLKDCWAVVVWGSNCATEALLRGVRVHFCGPHIVTEGASVRGVDMIEYRHKPDRLAAMRRLAWGQWSVDEIASGEAIDAVRDI